MITRAAVDRFEGKGNVMAVLIAENNPNPLVIGRNTLPEGTKTGDWVMIELDESYNVIKISSDPNAAEESARRIEDKMAALRRGNQLNK